MLTGSTSVVGNTVNIEFSSEGDFYSSTCSKTLMILVGYQYDLFADSIRSIIYRNHLLLFNLIVAMEFITMVFSYYIYIYIYVLYTYNYILNYMYGFFVNHEYSLYTLNYRFVV